MNILNTILNKIIPGILRDPSAQVQPPIQAAPPPQAASAAASAKPVTATTPSGTRTQSVDVEAVLKNLESRKSQKLDWHHSIVDLMKVLDMDSDLPARKQLAKELGYTGDTNDSAKMNVWLHAAVMKKLEENGGKVPESMKH